MTILPQLRPILNRIILTLAGILLTLTLLAGCKDQVEKDPANWAWLESSDAKILTKLAISMDDQVRGLSGTRDEDWPDDQAMMFVYRDEGPRAFWMPDTYFNLDLLFLDGNMKIVDIERNVPHFIGREPEESIPRIRSVWARHVVEMKSKSAVAAKLKVGDQLQFRSPQAPPQIK